MSKNVPGRYVRPEPPKAPKDRKKKKYSCTKDEREFLDEVSWEPAPMEERFKLAQALQKKASAAGRLLKGKKKYRRRRSISNVVNALLDEAKLLGVLDAVGNRKVLHDALHGIVTHLMQADK